MILAKPSFFKTGDVVKNSYTGTLWEIIRVGIDEDNDEYVYVARCCKTGKIRKDFIDCDFVFETKYFERYNRYLGI